MATGNPFVPTPFATTVVAPITQSLFRRTSYAAPSEFRFAPTAVSTASLVAGSSSQAADSLASLAQILARASAWADLICFHRSDGSLAASVATDRMWVKAKMGGDLYLPCNFKPVIEVVGLALGGTPSQLTNVSATTAADIWIDGSTIVVPGSWNVSTPPSGFPRPVGIGGGLYAVWQYISGFPNVALATSSLVNATSLTVTPSTPNGTTVAGVYAGTQLTIHDGAKTETVVVASTPTSTTIALAAPTAYAHTVPAAPDFIRVSSIPEAATQAVFLLAACLIKTQGARAQQMPHAPGAMPKRPMLAEAGAEVEYDIACKMLAPYTTVMSHG